MPLFAQVKLAAFAGPQATSAHYTVRDSKQTTSYKYGFMAGGGVKVPFDNQLYFFPSIYYSLKGYKVDLKDPSFPPGPNALNNNTTIHTIEICPMLQLDLSNKPSHPYIRFGPAVDFAFSGKESFDTLSNGGTPVRFSHPMVFSFGDYGRYTASANLHLGYESEKGFTVFAFYEHGFGSLNNADKGPKIFHRIWGISLGWMFGHDPLVLDTRVRE